MLDEKLGSPQLKHSHDTFFRAKYMWSPIPMQSCWYHNLHESHCTPGVLHFTAFWHIPQGNFGGLGQDLIQGHMILQGVAHKGTQERVSLYILGPFSLVWCIAVSR